MNLDPGDSSSTVIACSKILSGMPRVLRTDCGTKDTNLAFIQPYLRRSHADCFSGMESFRYGRSVSNQVRWMIVMLHTLYY